MRGERGASPASHAASSPFPDQEQQVGQIHVRNHDLSTRLRRVPNPLKEGRLVFDGCQHGGDPCERQVGLRVSISVQVSFDECDIERSPEGPFPVTGAFVPRLPTGPRSDPRPPPWRQRMQRGNSLTRTHNPRQTQRGIRCFGYSPPPGSAGQRISPPQAPADNATGSSRPRSGSGASPALRPTNPGCSSGAPPGAGDRSAELAAMPRQVSSWASDPTAIARLGFYASVQTLSPTASQQGSSQTAGRAPSPHCPTEGAGRDPLTARTASRWQPARYRPENP